MSPIKPISKWKHKLFGHLEHKNWIKITCVLAGLRIISKIILGNFDFFYHFVNRQKWHLHRNIATRISNRNIAVWKHNRIIFGKFELSGVKSFDSNGVSNPEIDIRIRIFKIFCRRIISRVSRDSLRPTIQSRKEFIIKVYSKVK